MRAHGWCRERDRRWPNYHAHAVEAVWPQSLVFLKPELGLMSCVRGAGGGSQQATFRGTLEQYLEAATAKWSGDGSGSLEERLLRLSRLVQHEFAAATEPYFATHFQAFWVCALTDGVDVALRTQGNQRAFLRRDGALRQLSSDGSLWHQRQASNPPLEPWTRSIELSMFRAGDFEIDSDGAAARFTWQSGDVLLLISGCPLELEHRELDSMLSAALTVGDVERGARTLYAAIEAIAPPHAWPRHGAVVLATPT